tara:strand:+ start:40 stop:810 length:771 start_codon:yes stop_codon:yes gene_type:complete
MVHFGNLFDIPYGSIYIGGYCMTDIIYTRVIEIKYEHEEEMDKTNKKRLASDLQKRGITLRGKYNDNRPIYEFRSVDKQTTTHDIYLDGKMICTLNDSWTRNKVVDAINALNNGRAVAETRKKVKSVKEWRQVQGNYIQVDNANHKYSSWSGGHKIDDVEVIAQVLHGYNEITLKIESKWSTDRIQRDEYIREMIVETPLELVGQIQKGFESAIKLKKYGYDVENVVVDCDFKVITASESKCSPDIIKMTREARNS